MAIERPIQGFNGLSEAKRRLLAQRLKGSPTSDWQASRIEPRPPGARIPISVDQYRIWLHASMQPDLPIYNEPITLHRRGNLKLGILEASFNAFLRRHEAWRTSFAVEDGEVVQVVLPELRVKLECIDLSGLPEIERESEARRLATGQALLPIDLERAPLFRTLVMRLGPSDHRFCLVFHHILFDGISIRRTFLPELAAIYSALESGRELCLAQPILQYPDYALWRQEQVGSPAAARHLDYWRKTLEGELPVLSLPSDRPRPAVISQRGGMEHFVISRELTASLRDLGRAHGATLYMTFVAAFKALLFRYSGQEDVIVGSATDGRRLPELQGMMGYILDTFAIRTRPSPRMPFSTYLAQVKRATLDALSAAEIPFDRVVAAVNYRSDLSHHPIFQAFFSFQPTAEEFPAGWEMTTMDVTVGAAKFDVYLEVEERPVHTSARILYSTDLFDADTIRRMSGHWLTLLEAICKTPDCTLGDLPLLTPAERELMLVKWNSQPRFAPPATIHGLVEAQVQRTPERLAVQFEKTSWTYAQLSQRSELLSSHLCQAGAGPNTLVAVLLDRSENLPASLLAILRTGAAYLPLDPRTPRARVLLCLEDAVPAVILTQRSFASELPRDEAKVLILEDVLEAGPIPASSGANSTRKVDPDDIAYVIHTSGSTGRPKGVELSHRSVVNLLLSMQNEPGFTESDTLLAVTTVSFDIAALELFLPLICGGRVVIASREAALDPHRLAKMMDDYRCTVMQATPATWRALLATDWPGRPGLRALCGGEPLTSDLAKGLLARGLELWNLYGPTETTIWSTLRCVEQSAGPIPIGRPIANTTTYILDANQQPVPIGVPGELYIGGAGLARGYRGQPALTAQKFVSPAIANGERLYRTGDYAIYRADGSIECQGRADNQVKIRGYRVELEDVESSLNAHPRVAAAAARVWPDSSGGNRLSAYVVGRNGPPPNASELREFLQSRLPEYMIPSDTVALDAMPLTSNGKLDREALSLPAENSSRPALELPFTETEQKLAEIWRQVLGVESVGRNDNFFDLGGHSLTLTHLFWRMNKEFASALPITAIFNAQTLSALAAVVKEKVRFSSLVPVQTAGTKPPLFMVHSYLLYRGLSKSLGCDQPFYGLRELEDDGDPSIDHRALRYIADMKKIQQRGPYRIAAWCAAGPLAIEMARQLLHAGEKVASIILFDSIVPARGDERQRKSPLEYAAILEKAISYHKDRTRGISMAAKLRYGWKVVVRSLKEARDRFYLRNWVFMKNLSKRFNFQLPQFMHNTSLQTFAAMREFRQEILPVHLTLIRSSESRHAAYDSVSCGWERIAGSGVEVLWAPGDHETMFTANNLEVTAALVKECLEG